MIEILAEKRVFAYSIAIIYNILMTYKRTKKISVSISSTVIAIILGTLIARIIWFINGGCQDIQGLFLLKLTNFKISGVLIGGMLGMIVSVRIFAKYKEELIDTMMESIFLSATVGKIECFIRGCCVGIALPEKILPYTGALGYKRVYFPIQLLEAIVWFGGFLILLLLKNKMSRLKRVSIAILEYVMARMFILEHLYKYRKLFGGPKMAAIYSCIIIICLIILVKDKKRKNNIANN